MHDPEVRVTSRLVDAREWRMAKSSMESSIVNRQSSIVNE
jgi:hypothetical protein